MNNLNENNYNNIGQMSFANRIKKRNYMASVSPFKTI